MINVNLRRAALVLAGALLTGCAHVPAPESAMNPSSAGAGWRSLFDGKTLTGWHVYRESGTPTNWAVVDGTIQRTADGGDLVTDEQFANFELALDWKITPGGNSGILYRVADTGDETYFTGPEMQVLDDTRHPDGKSPLTSAGSDYALYPAPRGVVKPVGEWNSVRLVVNGNHVEHWLNGVKVVEYDRGTQMFRALVNNSKYQDMPGFGERERGPILLQDHGNAVSFRSIKIRSL